MFVRCWVIYVLFIHLIDKVSLQVSGFVGDSVLLPCSYQDRELKPEDINVFWRYNESKNVYDIEKGNPSTNKQDAMFKGRIKSVLSRHENGNFSLILSNLMVTDTGQFSCDIPGVKKEFKLTLHVKAHPTTTSTTASNLKSTSDTRSSSMKTQPEGIATFLTVVLEFFLLHYICVLY
ncbi:V-set domain-containing T-cell activation inhibitor 1-like [Sinocyclocheilus anshuiensis]|uniref:V-set domain-containing T-cell activation inhibitor 1-like n=1 Tax=Sinocyclocheilus anshuiensis TaxID=1608454 RepID=UPI0007B9A063|nr:PREDICTED: V-set domain-containing T-cell activation inhibitor 1-like [Sinocyclocheilus anshuiensis]